MTKERNHDANKATTMKVPKASTLALMGIGLCILGSVSIAPNATTRTITANDGTTRRELDTRKYFLGNWFGFGSFAAGGVCVILAGVRCALRKRHAK